MGKKPPTRVEPGSNTVEVRLPAWLVLALWIWMTLLATAILALIRVVT